MEEKGFGIQGILEVSRPLRKLLPRDSPWVYDPLLPGPASSTPTGWLSCAHPSRSPLALPSV
eukprot:6609292-Pyramimonas_sp.AAC.1